MFILSLKYLPVSHCRYSNNYLYKVTSSGEGKRLSLQPTAGQQKLSEPVAGLVAKHREDCRAPACRGLVTSPDPELVQDRACNEGPRSFHNAQRRPLLGPSPS